MNTKAEQHTQEKKGHGPVTRAFSALLVYVLVVTWLYPAVSLLPQPAVVPDLNAPQFQSQDLDPITDVARGAPALSTWEMTVQGGLQNLSATWEAGVDATINATVGGVNQSDAFHTVTDYQDYMLRELDLQKFSSAVDWELAADSAAAADRIEFLAALGENRYQANYRSAHASLDDGRDQATNWGPGSQNRFDQIQYNWDRDFQADLQNGLYDYQYALNAVQNDYQTLMAALAAKDQEFQQGLSQIEQYEQTVRQGLGQAVAGMTNMLQTSGLFYDENCTGSTCTQGNLSAAGLQLQALLDSLNQGLQNNAPLSQLAQQMVTYLAQQHTYAVNRQQYWQNQINGTGQYISQSSGITLQVQTVCEWGVCNNIITGFTPPAQAQGVLDFQGNNQATLKNWLENNFESKQVTGITGATMTGSSDSWYITNDWLGMNDAELYGSSTQSFYFCARSHCENYNSAFWYLKYHLWYSLDPPGNHYAQPEQYLNYNITYTTKDVNAESNAQTWQGYVGGIAPVLQTWQNDLLPALENWEAQKASYAANYAAWQAEAQTQSAQAFNDFQNRQEELLTGRNQWLGRMDQRYRDDAREWSELQASLVRAEDSASAGVAGQSLDERGRESLQRLAASHQSRAAGLDSATLRPAPGISERQRALLEARPAPLPDGQKLLTVAGSFQSSLKGAFNLGLASTLDRRADEMREAAIDQIVQMASAQNGLIDVQRNLPQRAKDIDAEVKTLNEQKRAILDRVFFAQNVDYIVEKNTNGEGRIAQILTGADQAAVAALEERIAALQTERQAVLQAEQANRRDEGFQVVREDGVVKLIRKISTGRAAHAGGDLEAMENYRSIDRDQIITLATAGSVKLAQTGELFSDWDYGQVMRDFGANADAYNTGLNGHFTNLGNAIGQANQIALENESAWKNDAQGQINAARERRMLLQQIIQAMMTGGMSAGAAIKSTLQSEMQSRVYGAIAEATGLPAGLVGGLMSGKPPMEALTDHLENSLYNSWEQSIGISGAGSWLRELAEKAEERKKKHDAMKFAPDIKVNLSAKDLLNPVAVQKEYLRVQKNILEEGLEMAGGVMKYTKVGQSLADYRPMGFLPSYNDVDALSKNEIKPGQFVTNIGKNAVSYYKNLGEALTFQNGNNPLKWLGNEVANLPAIKVLSSALSNPPRPMGPGERAVRSGLVDRAAEMFPGLPKAFVSSMFVDGADMKTAMQQQLAASLASAAGLEGELAEHVQGIFAQKIAETIQRHELKKKRGKASQLKVEDVTSLGITYAWRNAQYHKDGQMLMDVIETAGSIAANALPGVGHAIYGAYMAAKQAYLGSVNGGTKGFLAGIVSGFSNAVVKSLSGGQLGMGLSYDSENGFGASLSVGMGPASYSMNFQEGLGLVSSGLSASYSSANGYGASLGLNFDAGGNFAGGSIGLNAELGEWRDRNISGSLGLNFDRDGHGTNLSANVSGSSRTKLGNQAGDENYFDYGNSYLNSMLNGGYATSTAGLGLSYNFQDGSTGMSISHGAGMDNGARFGISGWNAGATSNYNLSTGEFQGQNINLGFQTQSKDQAAAYIAERQKALNDQKKALQASGPLTPEEMREKEARLNALEAELAELDLRAKATRDDAEMLAEKLRAANFSEAEVREILANPDKLFSLETQLILQLKGISVSEDSREGILDTITGTVGDGLKWLAGASSSDLGEVDPATGEFRVRTCFTAGTLVRVKPDTPGSLEKNGHWFKKIEDIRVGDEALSWDETTGSVAYRRVSELFVRDTDLIYQVHFNDGSQLETTWNHRFYLADRGWVEARDIKIGDRSLTAPSAAGMSGLFGVALIAATRNNLPTVSQLHSRKHSTTVYNFGVEDAHTYFVTESMVLVHNDSALYRESDEHLDWERVVVQLENELRDRGVKYSGAGMWFGRDGVFTNMGERFANLWEYGNWTKDENLGAELKLAELVAVGAENQEMARRKYEHFTEKMEQAQILRDKEYNADLRAWYEDEIAHAIEHDYNQVHPSAEIISRVKAGIGEDRSAIDRERAAIDEREAGFWFGRDGVFTNLGERFGNWREFGSWTKDEALVAELRSNLESAQDYQDSMAARENLFRARIELDRREEAYNQELQQERNQLDRRLENLEAIKTDVEKNPYTYEKLYQEKTLRDYAEDLGTAALNLPTYAASALTRVLIGAPLSVGAYLVGRIDSGVRSLFDYDYADLNQTEQTYLARAKLASIRGLSPSEIPLDSPEVAEFQRTMQNQLESTSWPGRTWRKLNPFSDRTDADMLYEEINNRADHMLDYKESMQDKVDEIKLREPSTEAMAFVTRDEYGYIRAFDRQEIAENEGRARLFYENRPRVLIHGKGPGDPGANSFDLDSMAAYGNTISIFRDGSAAVVTQAAVVDAQLKQIEADRARNGSIHGFIDRVVDQPGFNIAAHSMANPVLLDLLARDNSVFKENGRFVYSRDDGSLRILGVAPAIGSSAANLIGRPGNDFLRSIGEDSPAARDLMEQNYDRLLDPLHPDFERYRQAREQFAKVVIGDISSNFEPTGALSAVADSQFGEPNDILVSHSRNKYFWQTGMQREVPFETIHLNHQDQIWTGVLDNYTDDFGVKHRYITETWDRDPRTGQVEPPPRVRDSRVQLGCSVSYSSGDASCESQTRPPFQWNDVYSLPSFGTLLGWDQETTYRPDYSRPAGAETGGE